MSHGYWFCSMWRDPKSKLFGAKLSAGKLEHFSSYTGCIIPASGSSRVFKLESTLLSRVLSS